MTDPSNHIRSFGMSGCQITDDLQAIEQKYGIELGHQKRATVQSAVDYYPQFEKEVRAEAAFMAQHFEVFYCLERSIRSLISDTLEDAAGPGWWDRGKVPPLVVAAVKDRQKKELDSAMTQRSEAEIDYTTFGELAVIITSNWDVFSTVLKSTRAVERVMSNLNMLRGPIAHCSPITEDEVVRLRLTVKDWFRLIG